MQNREKSLQNWHKSSVVKLNCISVVGLGAVRQAVKHMTGWVVETWPWCYTFCSLLPFCHCFSSASQPPRTMQVWSTTPFCHVVFPLKPESWAESPKTGSQIKPLLPYTVGGRCSVSSGRKWPAMTFLKVMFRTIEAPLIRHWTLSLVRWLPLVH